MKNKKLLSLIVALIAGLLVLLMAPPELLETFFSKKPHQENIWVKEVIGRVEKKSLSADTYKTIKSKSDISHGDFFISYADSKVLFDFNPPFWLMPFSKIEFVETETGEWIGKLYYGGIRKVNFPATGEKIDLTYLTEPILQDDFTTTLDPLITPLSISDLETFQEIPEGNASTENVLEKQIFQTLLLHKKFFQGCLIKHYKNKSGEINGGETVFDLLIDVSGAIESAQVTRTDIHDKEYLDCLKTVFSRIRFKNFRAQQPLHAIFPLNIEMP